MNAAIYTALVLTAFAFLAIGLAYWSGIKSLADFVPVAREGKARVRSSKAFSASTIATSISLATLISAYFGLAQFFGLWLLWTALTAALGMFVVYKLAPRIAAKLKVYSHVPSIHEFLSTEYGAPRIKPVAGAFTVVGLLLLLATELLVGSAFLSQLMPGSSRWVLTMALGAVPLAYVMLGGFETVIITDRIQMILIWIMIPAFLFVVAFSGDYSVERLQQAAALKPIDSGLLWFLVGIFLMNVPTALSSITVWQRISACEDDRVLKTGLLRSAIGILIGWSLLVIIAWAATTSGKATTGAEVCRQLLSGAARTPLSHVLVFVVIVGLYSALLSTASTFLIAVGHTMTTDILRWRDHDNASGTTRANSLAFSRVTIFVSSIASCGIVVLFEKLGYKIEDIIFSIYGGALALFPPMFVALLMPREKLKMLSNYAFSSITVGFIAGWTAALGGKGGGIQNLIFMSPAVGMLVSALVLAFGWFLSKQQLRR